MESINLASSLVYAVLTIVRWWNGHGAETTRLCTKLPLSADDKTAILDIIKQVYHVQTGEDLIVDDTLSNQIFTFISGL